MQMSDARRRRQSQMAADCGAPNTTLGRGTMAGEGTVVGRPGRILQARLVVDLDVLREALLRHARGLGASPGRGRMWAASSRFQERQGHELHQRSLPGREITHQSNSLHMASIVLAPTLASDPSVSERPFISRERCIHSKHIQHTHALTHALTHPYTHKQYAFLNTLAHCTIVTCYSCFTHIYYVLLYIHYS